MFSTYKPQDVQILLKDITGMVTPLGTKEREAKIQSGTHYSEMLPIEYVPSKPYLDTFYQALEKHAKITAYSVASVSQKIWKDKGKSVALVSLARAGTPVGILIKHYIQKKSVCNFLQTLFLCVFLWVRLIKAQKLSRQG